MSTVAFVLSRFAQLLLSLCVIVQLHVLVVPVPYHFLSD